MNNYNELAETIKLTYEKSLFGFATKYQYHFAVRLWRVEPDDIYLNPILMDYQYRLLYNYPRLLKFVNGEGAGQLGSEMLNNFVPTSGKTEKRKEFYEKHPEILFYLRLIYFLFLTKTFNLHSIEPISGLFGKTLNKLQAIRFKDWIFNEELLRFNPTDIGNTTYYLQFLEIEDLEAHTLRVLKDYWMENEPENELDWKNKIYGLTHLILPASYFYQRFVERQKYDYILTYFEKNIDYLIEKTNADIVAEVGLCFKLCGDTGNEVVEKVKKHLASLFDKEKGMIMRENGGGSIDKLEHRNIVAHLIFKDFSELHVGPNLLDYLKENRRALYLPQEVVRIGLENEAE